LSSLPFYAMINLHRDIFAKETCCVYFITKIFSVAIVEDIEV